MEFAQDGGVTSDVAERLNNAWHSHNIAEACGILMDDVMPRCLKWLLNGFGHQGVSHEDTEDCFNDAVEGLLKRDPSKVNNPYNYVFTSAKNTALDLLRERKHLVRYNPEWDGSEEHVGDDADGSARRSTLGWHADILQIITEAVLDAEVTARGDQLRAVFGITLPKLAPARRRLIELFLDRGADITNATLAGFMNRSETALKSLKSRTFDDLRDLLPLSAHELGINFYHFLAPSPEISVRRPSFPSPEEDIEPGGMQPPSV